ncbi:MAG: DsbA family protein [Rubellimicrobium sp.]|nr:DsbA family protein [Rubellimicrobium sp.]
MMNFPGLATLAAVVVIGGGLAAVPGATFAQDTAAPETAPEAAQEAVTIADMSMGSPDAPVTIIEYGSFTCPHCASFHANQLQSLQADYIDTGKVQFIFREVYFDRFGLWASMVARCGGEMRFFGISDVLYDTQADWIAGGQDPALIADNLRRIGIGAGLEADQVDACMRDEATARALVAWFEENARTDGIEATPTLIIDGVKYSNMAYSEMQPIIDAALAD